MSQPLRFLVLLSIRRASFLRRHSILNEKELHTSLSQRHLGILCEEQLEALSNLVEGAIADSIPHPRWRLIARMLPTQMPRTGR